MQTMSGLASASMVRTNKTGQNDTVPAFHRAILWDHLLSMIGVELGPASRKS
jgi:hypothetical protein